MIRHHSALGLALVLSCVDASPAQETARSLPDAVPIAQRATGLSPSADGLVGLGADYRATFDSSSVVYLPALGRRAPRSYPLSLSFVSMLRGDRAMPVAVDSAPVARGSVVSYRRAGGVTEHWEVRADGVALSYVLARRPAGTGDLVVRLRVDTALVAPRGELADGIAFSAGDQGGVHVGGVTGIDAAGWRVPGTLRFDGDHLDLVLPARFVDAAAYPMTLDPLVGTDVRLGGFPEDDIHADVAYNETHDVYIVVWQREYSGLDAEIRAQRVDKAGVPISGVIAVSATSDIAMNPTVASVVKTNAFLVCWQQGPSPFGPWDILGAAVDPLTGNVSPTVTIAAAAGDEVDPDAGSDSSGADDEAVVVWQEIGVGIRGAQVHCPGASGTPFPFPVLTLGGGVQYEDPAISQNGGQNGRHVVVWTHRNRGIRAIEVDRNLVALTPVHSVTNNALDSAPDVDGDGDLVSYVVWQHAEVGGSSIHDVFCQRVDYASAAGTLSNNGSAAAVAGDVGEDERQPTVGYLGPKCLVAWSEKNTQSPGPLTYRLRLKAISPATCLACGLEYSTAVGGLGYDFGPSIASQLSGGGTGDEALVALSSAQEGPPFLSEVRVQLFEALGPSTGAVNLGGGCGSAGTAGTLGRFVLATTNFAFVLTRAPASATSAALVLNGSVAPIPCGPCLLTPPLTSVILPVSAGSARLPVKLPCSPGLVGGIIQFQWWVIGPRGGGCVLPNVTFTDRLEVTVGV